LSSLRAIFSHFKKKIVKFETPWNREIDFSIEFPEFYEEFCRKLLEFKAILIS